MRAELHVSLPCPIPGFEEVAVVFDMLASEEMLDRFRRRLGSDETAAGVVVRVEGWDSATFGEDPWGKKSPLGFRAWAARRGFAEAAIRFADDVNFSMASTPSMRPTRTAAS